MVGVGDISPAASTFAVPIKPKATLKIKTKSRDSAKPKLRPFGAISR